MAKCYQLVGVPGSGKTTWVGNQDWMQNLAQIGTDKWVEIFAREVGQTYSEVFDHIMPVAVDLMIKEAILFRDLGRDIIWDQTSTTVTSRRRKFATLPDHDHIAIVFRTPDDEELARRLASRPGKTIPDHVVRNMIKHFEMPTEVEGFKEIWHVN